VEAVRAGDARAFETIFDRYHRQLLSFCRHMLGTREEAEDVLQQTFMAAHRHLTASRKHIHLRAWLFTIARNNCLSALRRRRESVALEETAVATEGLASEVQRREDLRDLLRDLGGLPVDQREALVLSELGSLSHEEIASVIGCNPKKVKALVFQARSSLAASRSARELPCDEVQEQLATLSGGSLRRTGLRRHVRECAGCREFEQQVRYQRKAMAVLMPVVPAVGLKSTVLGAVGVPVSGGVAASVAAGGVGALVGGSGGVTKLVAAGVVAAGLGAGGVAAVRSVEDHGPATKPPPVSKPQSRSAVAAPQAGVPGAGVGTPSKAAGKQKRAKNDGAKSNSRSRSDEAPGRAGASPGRAGTSPGRSGETPGRSGDTPGKGGDIPGKSGSTPGQAGTAPGRSGDTPGQSGATPGQSGTGSVSGSSGSGSSSGPPPSVPASTGAPAGGPPASAGPPAGKGGGNK
jgi:RNA polymerase sigma factor (sigma-70 family)